MEQSGPPRRGAIDAPELSGQEITGLLQQWRGGNRDAFDRLIPAVYNELRVIASRRLAREWRGSGLQTTALVNEAYLKLVGQRGVAWQNRAHFFAIAAQLTGSHSGKPVTGFPMADRC